MFVWLRPALCIHIYISFWWFQLLHLNIFTFPECFFLIWRNLEKKKKFKRKCSILMSLCRSSDWLHAGIHRWSRHYWFFYSPLPGCLRSASLASWRNSAYYVWGSLCRSPSTLPPVQSTHLTEVGKVKTRSRGRKTWWRRADRSGQHQQSDNWVLCRKKHVALLTHSVCQDIGLCSPSEVF